MATVRIDMREAAERLAQWNADSEESVVRIWWFPSEEEIRLIEVDDSTLAAPDKRAQPYYFPARLPEVPYPCGIALVRPEEEQNIALPAAWNASWNDAVLIFERGNGKRARSSRNG